MSNHARRRPMPKKSPLMGKQHGGQFVDPEHLDAHLATVLATCTCTPILHAYNAGHGQDAIAILHEPGCRRLGVLAS